MNKIKNSIKKMKGLDSFWKKLIKNSFYAIIGESGASVINVFVIILLVRLIGNKNYGILVLAQSYMLMVDTIINMQSWNSVIKYGEEALKKDETNLYLSYIKLGTVLDVSTAVLGTIIGFLIADFIGYIFNWPFILTICSKIFVIEILFHFSGTPTAILRVENKFNLISIQKVVTSLLKLIAIAFVLIIFKKVSLINGTLIFLITDIIGHLILTVMAYIVVKKKYGIEFFKKPFPNNSKEFVKFTFWNTLTDISDIPVQNLDVFIVSAIGMEKVAIYKVFKQIMSILSKLTKPLYQAIYPQFSELVAEKKYQKGYDVVIIIRNIILKYGIPLSLLIGVLSPVWLNVLFGKIYASNWHILFVYMIIHILAISYTTIHPFFVSLGNAFKAFVYSLISNVLFILVGIVLVNNIGLIGIIIAYCVQAFSLIMMKKHYIEKNIMRG